MYPMYITSIAVPTLPALLYLRIHCQYYCTYTTSITVPVLATLTVAQYCIYTSSTILPAHIPVNSIVPTLSVLLALKYLHAHFTRH